MSKQVIKGWIERSIKAEDFFHRGEEFTTLNETRDIRSAKGDNLDWFGNDWPQSA